MTRRGRQDEEVLNVESGEPVPEEVQPEPVKIEPGFFAQRNPKLQVARGKDRRIATEERRKQGRRQ